MKDYRIETDFLGELKIPANALYGIHSMRARENFPDQTPFHKEWYEAMGWVKRACYNTYGSFKKTALKKYPQDELPFSFFDDEIIIALQAAAEEVSRGDGYEDFIVPAVQGGAGTSINLNINEIIANLSLTSLLRRPGDYEYIDPFNHANIYQSTNDVVPTALKLALMFLLRDLEKAINDLRLEVEKKEGQYRNVLRPGYTQMQEAVPTSFGKLFSSYSEALSRDWWRVSKCFERIKVVNLGGSAVGTGIAVPRFFIMEVVPELRRLTGLPVTRSENLPDATSNLDSFVEVHAIMKSFAVNLEKMVNDMRLLASDLSSKTLKIPNKQVGSSIMPGKVNPVIPEFVVSAAHQVYANDGLVTRLSAQGCLELNAYLPMIGHAMISSMKLMIAAAKTLKTNLIEGMEVSEGLSYEIVMKSPVLATALSPYVGYHKAAELAKYIKENQCSIQEANQALQMIEAEKLEVILKAENLLKTGFSLGDIV
jgi:aspartate ammonia-lyase